MLRATARSRRREHAWRVAGEAARRLRSEFGAEQVWAFGSLVRDGVFDERSDIDLAASGVPEAALLDAVRMLLGLDRAFLVDLVRIEAAPPELRAVVEVEGVRL